MHDNAIVIQGTLNPDGTLVLDEKLNLPAGRVRVTVQPIISLKDDPFWQTLEKIWADQRARGHVPRTREEIDAEIQELRDEWEEHQQKIERLQEECAEERRKREASQE
jgi:hypothetical protein